MTDGAGNPVPGATVIVVETGTGTATDQQGAYTLSLTEGTYRISASSLGYAVSEKGVTVTGAEVVDFTLDDDITEIEGIVVSTTSPYDRVRGVQIGAEKIDMSDIAKLPSMFGERDLMKSIQLLPGIKAESDGSSGYQVRGGTTSQNMILLDDAPVYNAGHLLGFFSAFNDDALLDATLYKGLIPAQYGHGTSSVFTINTRNGSSENFRFGGSVGLLSAKLYAEGPMIRDKASLFVAARRTYLDAFLGLTEDYRHNTLNFYDINAKLSYDISSKDRLFISFFNGRDHLGLKNYLGMKWGNMTGTVRWFHCYGPELSSTTSGVWSGYSTNNGAEIADLYYSFIGYIRQTGVKHNFHWTPGSRHSVDIGFQSMWMRVLSADWQINGVEEREKRRAWENSVWINDEWKITPTVTLSAGVRLNAFSAMGGSPYYELDAEGDIVETKYYSQGKFVKTWVGLEPRLSLNWQLTERQSVKAGLSRTTQNIHAIRNTSVSLPFDRYTMSSNLIRPQKADQVSVGYAALSPSTMFEYSAEAYIRKVYNVLDYREGKSFNSEIEIERIVAAGKGRSYGFEFMAKKNAGRWTGWLSYTLSWSQNRIPGINRDRWYTASNDRRHDLSVVAMYDLSARWQLSATWVYNTGQAMTGPSAKYEIDGETVYYYAERNGYRAPDYHRLDVSATYRVAKPRWTHEVTFGLYNAYNRYNFFIIQYKDDDNYQTGTRAKQVSLFGVVPSVAYNFKF